MRKTAALTFTAISLFVILTVSVRADFDPSENYMSQMISAAATGSINAGLEAERARSDKINGLSLCYREIGFTELYLLSKIIYAEAGSYWLSDEWKMNTGEVVLNRVASPEFPNTVSEVIYQPGQYYGRSSSYFERLRPNERCILLALRLLEGERHMKPSVVFQANFRQGSGVYTSYYDRYLGWTYFCYSSNRHLYAA